MLLYTLVLAEAFLVVAAPQPLFPRYITAAPWGVRHNIPGADYKHYSAEVAVSFHINNQGMRSDQDFTEVKPSNLCRVAMLGDSFFMGYELELRDTIAAKLDARLKRDGFKIEVLNFSVSGLGTAELLRTYEGYARRFSPDAVLLEWDRSVFDDNLRSGLYRLDNGALVEAAASYLPGVSTQDWLNRSSLYRWVANNSELYALVRDRASVAVRRMMVQVPSALHALSGRPSPGARPPDAPGASGRDDSITLSPGAIEIRGAAARLSAALLERFRDEVSADKAGFLILDIPEAVSRVEFVSTFKAFPRDVADRLPVVQTIDALKAAAKPNLMLYFEKGNGHLTPPGVDVVVDTLLPRVEGLPQLARCR